MSEIELLCKLQLLKNEEIIIKKELKESNALLINLIKEKDTINKEKELILTNYNNMQMSLLNETLDLEKSEEDIRKYEKDLFSSYSNNPKLLKELDEKIKELKSKKDKLEDNILILMDNLEVEKKNKKNIENKSLMIEEKLKEMEINNQNKISDTSLMLEEIGMRLIELKSSISQESISYYENAFLKGQGIAVSLIKENCCSMCKSNIPLSIIEKIKKEQETLHFCENCGRILYLG